MTASSTKVVPAVAILVAAWAAAGPELKGQGPPASERLLQPMDVFQLEYVDRPRISPDGTRIVYERHAMDVSRDVDRSSLWSTNFDGGDQRPLSSGDSQDRQPIWSPDGQRIFYVSSGQGSPQLFVRWMDTGQTARLTQLPRPPASLCVSPDGKSLAFSMLVPHEEPPLVQLPKPPAGAEWADPPKVIRRMEYRSDGAGYLESGYQQLFLAPTEGGTPRQLTFGPYHHAGPVSWSPDSSTLFFSANRRDDWEFEPLESEIYALRLEDGEITALTERRGPDHSPVVSPDGKWIAYAGCDDRGLGFHHQDLYVMDRDGGNIRCLTAELDRSVQDPVFSGNGQGVYFAYDDRGRTRIAYVSLDGELQNLAEDMGGTTLGRPYSSGSFSVSQSGRIAYARTSPQRPADLAVADGVGGTRVITDVNRDLLDHKELAAVEPLEAISSHDGRPIQAWLVKPPRFDSGRKYPLILEIHGGPYLNYGPRFAAEMQLYAAAGYVVLYVNPRGSTSYGAEFANLIHHNYPGEDYDDLMSAVDAALATGWVDADNLFVTGGSGGGVLTAWIIGKTRRFRAAVVAKPVINWYSFALTADRYSFFYRYWFSGFPWDQPQEYLRRSPISLVGDVATPTMLLTGEEDYRTPISETEQYYQALQLRKVESVLVRIPGASHSITARPSRLIAKTSHVLAWFDKHRGGQADPAPER